MSSPHFAVSLMCMDLAHAAEQIGILNQHAYSFHCDVMDGHFAPNLALSPDWIKAIAPYSQVRKEAHLMADDVDRWLKPLADAGVDLISPHLEAIRNEGFRVMDRIRSLGCGTGLVLNPLTPFEAATPILPRVDLLTFMSIDTGFAGQPFIDEVLPKIEAAAVFREREGLHYEIQVDGHCYADTFRRVVDSGADTLILGNAGLFSLSDDLEQAWKCMEHNFSEAMEAGQR